MKYSYIQNNSIKCTNFIEQFLFLSVSLYIYYAFLYKYSIWDQKIAFHKLSNIKIKKQNEYLAQHLLSTTINTWRIFDNRVKIINKMNHKIILVNRLLIFKMSEDIFHPLCVYFYIQFNCFCRIQICFLTAITGIRRWRSWWTIPHLHGEYAR